MALLSMRELWEMVGQPLVNTGRGQEMSVFLNWIWVASVYSATQVLPTVQSATPPGALLANAGLLGFLGSVVQQWLPGLVIITPALQPVVGGPQVVGLLQQFLNNQ